MSTCLVLQFLLAYSLAVSLPTVSAETCYKEGINYSNCDTCYQTFAHALVNTDNNQYELSKAFFPTESAASVHVGVTYTDGVNATTYYWIMGGFYAIQPVNIFLYRSLFFSPPTYRQSSVNVTLPSECLVNDDYLEYATQRVCYILHGVQLLIVIIMYFYKVEGICSKSICCKDGGQFVYWNSCKRNGSCYQLFFWRW